MNENHHEISALKARAAGNACRSALRAGRVHDSSGTAGGRRGIVGPTRCRHPSNADAGDDPPAFSRLVARAVSNVDVGAHIRMAFKLTYSDGQESQYDDDTVWEVENGVLKLGKKEGTWSVLLSPSHWAVIELGRTASDEKDGDSDSKDAKKDSDEDAEKDFEEDSGDGDSKDED
ncbi:hypothetical protein GCM10023114_05890 [Mycolicibacterium sediminis]|uniref:Uncharacterized protein n=2 Tax=Mycolicibacterium sediminis TaxID=1286180 RepID=A0A7I7QZP3_9MYCO|nr:hypothetical protein MSEDJ_58780 [Mycolicibacterium sediminis]